MYLPRFTQNLSTHPQMIANEQCILKIRDVIEKLFLINVNIVTKWLNLSKLTFQKRLRIFSQQFPMIETDITVVTHFFNSFSYSTKNISRENYKMQIATTLAKNNHESR